MGDFFCKIFYTTICKIIHSSFCSFHFQMWRRTIRFRSIVSTEQNLNCDRDGQGVQKGVTCFFNCLDLSCWKCAFLIFMALWMVREFATKQTVQQKWEIEKEHFCGNIFLEWGWWRCLWCLCDLRWFWFSEDFGEWGIQTSETPFVAATFVDSRLRSLAEGRGAVC